MAKIVAGFGVPHNPGNPEAVRKGATEIGALYGKIAEEVRRAELDALVVFSSDHMNTFFLDNLPLFAVGVTDQSAGPNDGTLMPRYDVPVHEALAGHVRKSGLRNSFDLAVSQEFELDHTFMVPLHFLTPGLTTPIVPVFITNMQKLSTKHGRVHPLAALRKLEVTFGAPVLPERYLAMSRDEFTELIREQIVAVRPAF